MSPRLRNHWATSIGQLRRPRPHRRTVGSFPFHRRLCFEPLEKRRLLVNVTVSNINDVVNGNVDSMAWLIGTTGDSAWSEVQSVLGSCE
jgi:hypothetical protein